jgi:hypothetical protein
MRSIAEIDFIRVDARSASAVALRDNPNPDAKSCTAMNQAAASTVNVVTEGCC